MAAVTLSSYHCTRFPTTSAQRVGVWWGWWFLGNRIEDASITPNNVGVSLLCVW